MNAPLVTIGIPAFKGKYFKEALECWVRQSYTNFEVFVQDDASPDNLKCIFDEVCGHDPRFHYERNEKNSAPNFVDNWMKTLDKASGEFFVLGSDDDLYEPDYILEMVSLAQKYPNVDFFDCNHDFFNDRGPYFVAPLAPEYRSQIDWIYSLVYAFCGIIAQSVMCRVSAIRSIGGFDNLPAAWGGCDWLTWCKLVKNGAVFNPRLLMHWRRDGGNTTSSLSRYWLQQKLSANNQARPLWKQLAESLAPKTPVEQFKCAYIKRIMVDQYLAWHPSFTIAQLPFDMFVVEMVRQWRCDDLSFGAMLRKIYDKLMRNIVRPRVKQALRIIFYPIVVITRSWRNRK